MATIGERLAGWQAEFVDESRVARLGTNSPGGWPHLAPVCFARLGDALYIPIDEKPKAGGTLARVNNIQRDGKATLLIDRYDDAWESLAWVRIEGDATVLERGASEPGALESLRSRYVQYRSMALEERQLIVIETRRVVSWRWDR